jgi:hypothetical protein
MTRGPMHGGTWSGNGGGSRANGSIGAFGEVVSAKLTPIVQVTAQYGLRGEVETLALGAGAKAEAVDSKFSVESGTGASNLASIASTRLATYRAGQGLVARFTALFTQGVEGSTQASGLLSSESGFSFGYNGDDFGIVHARGGDLEQWDIKITTPATASEVATVTIDGNSYPVNITSGTVAKNAYEISTQLNAVVAGYSFSSVGDTVNVLASISDLGGGVFSFSSPTATASLTKIKSGVIADELWYPSSEWNVRPNYPIDPTLGNVYQIQMQYLGFGGIKFFIENKSTANFDLVHVIRYADSSIDPSVSNPIFRVAWGVRNTGNTNNLTVQGASGAIFIEGDVEVDTGTIGRSVFQPLIGSALTSVLSLQSRRTYFGTANRAEIMLRSLVLSTDSTKPARFSLIRNPVVATGEFLEFTSLGDNNLGQISETAAEIIGGEVIAEYSVGPESSFSVELGEVAAVLLPGEIACIAANTTGGNASTMGASLTWQDDL